MGASLSSAKGLSALLHYNGLIFCYAILMYTCILFPDFVSDRNHNDLIHTYAGRKPAISRATRFSADEFAHRNLFGPLGITDIRWPARQDRQNRDYMFQPSITMTSALLLAGTAQGIFLSIVLFSARERNKTANRYLACLLIVLALGLLDGFFTETNYYMLLPALIGVEWPANFLYGPFIYFYVSSLVRQTRKIPARKVLPHLIPCAALSLYLLPLYLTNSREKAVWWSLTGGSVKADTIRDVDPVIVLVIIQMLIYLAFSLRLIATYTTAIKQNYSSLDKIRLSWLRNLILVFISLCCMYVFFTILSPFYGVYREAGFFLHLSCVVVIFVMGYRGIGQPQIFAGMDDHELLNDKEMGITEHDPPDAPLGTETGTVSKKDKKKYEKSSLTSQQAENLLTKLMSCMEEERPFLEMGLTMPELAEMLSTSPNHLSQVINENLGKNFFDFVNEYRVEEAKKLLVRPESESRFSILDIAMEAGFNSKSSFYNAFKKITGMTPTRYRESHAEHAGVIGGPQNV